jgi:hypothetical protein
VTKRSFAIGWLNRKSLLYSQKVGRGAYCGATWHTACEVRHFFAGLPGWNLSLMSAVFLPDGGPLARVLEVLLPHRLPWGALMPNLA